MVEVWVSEWGVVLDSVEALVLALEAAQLLLASALAAVE